MTPPAATQPLAAGPVLPLVDLALQHEPLAEEILEGIAAVVRDGDLVLGGAVGAFERELAAHHHTAHAVGVANGTDAIELALRAVGVRAGDEVVLPANTFIATAEAVVRAGGRVVLADCDPVHLLLDPDRVAAALTPRTRAVVAVHLYGQAAPVEELRAATGPAVAVVEDAAQAQGAVRHGRSVMGLGDVAATSFYPGKNLGAWGDAGAVLTDRAEVAAIVRSLRNHGSTNKHDHPLLGTNSRLDTIQAVVLRTKLRCLEAWNADRRRAAARYDDLLAGLEEVVRPSTAPGNVHVWHLYPIRVAPERRDRALAALEADGIGVGIHYPVPIHRQGAFAHLGLGEGTFPVAEAAGRSLLSLPIYPGITADQQAWVVESLARALER